MGIVDIGMGKTMTLMLMILIMIISPMIKVQQKFNQHNTTSYQSNQMGMHIKTIFVINARNVYIINYV